MLYSPFLPQSLAYSGVSPGVGSAVSPRVPLSNPAPQIGGQQIAHPMTAYQPMMMGPQMARGQQGGGLGGINPQQLAGLLGMLKGAGGVPGGGMQYMGTLPGGTANYGPGLLAAAAQGVNPELAMGGL